MDNKTYTLVTRNGECFEIQFQGNQTPQNRNGTLFLFHLKDLNDQSRGIRLVSVFRFGPEKFYAPNYQEREEAVLFNVIRRAFDAGRLTFDGGLDAHTYTEIALQLEDFGEQKAASAGDVQNLITHEAYWLGFRHTQHPGYPVSFDSPTDLDYLGVTSDLPC
jgi:hypothetical protein